MNQQTTDKNHKNKKHLLAFDILMPILFIVYIL